MNVHSLLRKGTILPENNTRKHQLSSLRQEQILTAALDIFSQKGYSAATVSEIARKANLAAGTIYLYFPNKRDLFIKVIENLIVTPLLSIFENGTAGDFADVLKQALNNRLELVDSSFSSHLVLLMSEILRDSELKEYFYQTALQPLLKRIITVFGNQQSSGILRSADPEITVRLVAGLIIGMTIMRNVEGESSPFAKLSLEQTSHEIMHFIQHGVMTSD
jgi:AcrR family transcriptional regulator